jgi:hypothetical protein
VGGGCDNCRCLCGDDLKVARNGALDGLPTSAPLVEWQRLVAAGWTPGTYRTLAEMAARATAVRTGVVRYALRRGVASTAERLGLPEAEVARLMVVKFVLAHAEAGAQAGAPWRSTRPWLMAALGQTDWDVARPVMDGVRTWPVTGSPQVASIAAWNDLLGDPRTAALAYTAGLSLTEACKAQADGTLNATRLAVLAMLRGWQELPRDTGPISA